MQEEERERRMDFVPDESAVNTEHIEVRFSKLQQQTLLSRPPSDHREHARYPEERSFLLGSVVQEEHMQKLTHQLTVGYCGAACCSGRLPVYVQSGV